MPISVTVTLITFLLYIFAPSEYSLKFNVLLCSIFIINGLSTYKIDKKIDFPGFHLLFSIAFLCVTYLYPLFVYNISSSFSLFAISSYSDTIITKATALATFAYSCYCLGYVQQVKKSHKYTIATSFNLWSPKQSNRIIYITIFIFIIFILTGGLDFYISIYNKDAGEVSGLSRYVVMILQSFIIIVAMLYIFCDNMKVRLKILVALVTISGIIIITGSRTLPLFALLLIGYVLSYTHKIKKLYIYIAFGVGVLGMSIIGSLRTGDVVTGVADFSYEVSEIGRLDVLTDLIVCNRNLYASYDIVEKSSCTYGLTFVGPLFSPIPFLQSVFLQLTNLPSDYLYSAAYLTRYELGAERSVGLGTHIVADVYLAFGFVGLILFYLLGRLVVYARTKMRGNHPGWTIIYLTLFADSIYLCRASYLHDLRYMCWALLFYYILLNKKRLIVRKDKSLLSGKSSGRLL